jgi:hypothetical protein
LRGDQDATASRGQAISSTLSPVVGWRIPWRGQGQGLGTEDPGMERGSRGASPKVCSPRGALMRWAGEWAKEGVKVDWEHLLPPKGFQVLPRRWVVERTFSWLDQNRRMSKDYERLCASGEALVYAAMIRLMTRRLIRLRGFFIQSQKGNSANFTLRGLATSPILRVLNVPRFTLGTA